MRLSGYRGTRKTDFHNVLNVGFKSVRHMKAYKKHLSQQQDLQQQEQRNSCFGIRKPVVWDPYHRRASVEPSSGDFTAAMSSLSPSSRPCRERFRGRSASLGRLHCDGQPDTAEEPRLQPAHLAAFSTFS